MIGPMVLQPATEYRQGITVRNTDIRRLWNLQYSLDPGISFDEITKELLKPPNLVHIAFIAVSFSFAVIAAGTWVKPIDWVKIRDTQLEDGTQAGQGAGQRAAQRAQEDLVLRRIMVNFLVRAPLPLAFGTGESLTRRHMNNHSFFLQASRASCLHTCTFTRLVRTTIISIRTAISSQPRATVLFVSDPSNSSIEMQLSLPALDAWVGYGLLYSSMMVTWMYAYSYHGRAKANQVPQGQPNPEYFEVQPVSVIYCAGEIFKWFREFFAAVREARENLQAAY